MQRRAVVWLRNSSVISTRTAEAAPKRYARFSGNILGGTTRTFNNNELPFSTNVRLERGIRTLVVMSKIRGLDPVMRVRRDWVRTVMSATQHAIGFASLDQQPHRATRALLSKAPPPKTRLEELVLFGLLFETAVGGFGKTRDSARRAARIALRRLLPRTRREEWRPRRRSSERHSLLSTGIRGRWI